MTSTEPKTAPAPAPVTPPPVAPAPAPTAPEPTPTPPAGLPTGWRGPLLPVNTISGDGRVIVLEGTDVPARPMPLAFQAQDELEEGHDGARVIGLITRVWLQDGFVWGEGPFDLADECAAEWARKLGDGFAGWVSIDLSDSKVEEIPIDEAGNPIPDAAFAEWGAAMAAWEMDPYPGGPPPAEPVVADVQLQVTAWKVMAATLVSSPAFEDARVVAVYDEFTSTPAAPALTAAALEEDDDAQEHTGAMIALVPADPGALALDGGDPPDQLHLTLAYLGEASAWTPDAQKALTDAVGTVLGSGIDASVFGHASFNPDGPEPCAVYLVDSPGAYEFRDAVWDVLSATAGIPALPEQHEFIPHITAGYGLDVSALTFTGPVHFGAVRIAFAGVNTDLPLDTEAVAAAAGVQYRADDFQQPEPDHYVDHWQVTADGRVSMHLAAWGECHIGFANQCITPPAGVEEYARFHRIAVDTDAGRLKVGKITMGTGHASTDPGVTAGAAMAHYDNTGTLAAVVRCTDGVHGPWLSGHLVPWATARMAQELAHHEVSGDWRGRTGRLELVAALAVNVPGFMRSVAASGAGALVAAGRPRGIVRPPRVHANAPITREHLAEEVQRQVHEFITASARSAKVAPIDERMRAATVAKLDRQMWGTR